MFSDTRFKTKLDLVHSIHKQGLPPAQAPPGRRVQGKTLKEEPTKYTNVSHTAANFIDDSSSVIRFEDPTEVSHYLDRFMKILKVYYYDKLCINADKTSLINVSRPGLSVWKDEVKIYDNNEVIEAKPQICILGWLINEKVNQDSNL